MSLISRRNLTRSGALFACLASLAFSQPNSPDIGYFNAHPEKYYLCLYSKFELEQHIG